MLCAGGAVAGQKMARQPLRPLPAGWFSSAHRVGRWDDLVSTQARAPIRDRALPGPYSKTA